MGRENVGELLAIVGVVAFVLGWVGVVAIGGVTWLMIPLGIILAVAGVPEVRPGQP